MSMSMPEFFGKIGSGELQIYVPPTRTKLDDAEADYDGQFVVSEGGRWAQAVDVLQRHGKGARIVIGLTLDERGGLVTEAFLEISEPSKPVIP